MSPYAEERESDGMPYGPEPPYDVRDECASHGHEEYTQAVDRFGRRCYCGLVRYLDLVQAEPTV